MTVIQQRSSEDSLVAWGRGKSGGARVVYYYRSERMPVLLLSAYAKNERANLTQAEKNSMKRLIPALVAGYPRKKPEIV